LAAAVSMVLYESRREGEERPSVPKGATTEAVDACQKLWAEIEADEAAHGLSLTREPDPGFVWPMYRWARGEPLARVLASGHNYDSDMPAGDFVRWARQVLDLLGQIKDASGASPAVRETARKATAAVNRGVLAYQSGL
jgi:ATP-dependent RNA helicase HelY